MDFTQVMVTIITLIGTILTAVVIPLVKRKLDKGQLETLDYWMRVLVAAAETKFKGESMGEKKKEWVLGRLSELGLKFDYETVGNAIDGLCRELTAGLVINGDKA